MRKAIDFTYICVFTPAWWAGDPRCTCTRTFMFNHDSYNNTTYVLNVFIICAVCIRDMFIICSSYVLVMIFLHYLGTFITCTCSDSTPCARAITIPPMDGLNVTPPKVTFFRDCFTLNVTVKDFNFVAV